MISEVGERGFTVNGFVCRWIAFVMICVCVVGVWTFVLPRLGASPPLRGSIDRREALGVNADAMFYTELDAMETLVVRWSPQRD